MIELGNEHLVEGSLSYQACLDRLSRGVMLLTLASSISVGALSNELD